MHTFPRLSPIRIVAYALLMPTPALAIPQFGEPQELTDSLAKPDSVQAVDLSGDGIPDLLSRSTKDGVDVWYPGLGAGVFGAKRILAEGLQEPTDVGAADLDGDGTIDIFGTTAGDRIVRWYQGLGAGSFSPASFVTVLPDPPAFLDAADLDADGDLDLLVTTVGSGLFWIEIDAGAFLAPVPIATQSSTISAVAAGDMDGDGRDDIAYRDSGAFALSWIRNLSGGAFGSPQQLASMDGVVEDLYLGDLDSDGDIDVTYHDLTESEITTVRGLGAGAFGPPELLTNVFSLAELFELSDADGDGDPDLLVGDTNRVTVFLNQGGGTTWDPNVVLLGAAPGTMDCADLDGDSIPDLAVASGALQLGWHRNLGGAVAYAPGQPVPGNADFVLGAIAEDMDQDGDLDAVSSSSGDGKIAWYENLGNGQFADQVVLAVDPTDPRALRAGDLDSDGDLDLVWNSTSPFSIQWLEQTGPGVWAAPIVLAALPSYPYDFAVADLDQDGDLEIVQPLSDAQCVHVYENLGGGAFGAPLVLSSPGSPERVEIGILQSPGRQDIVTLDPVLGKIRRHTNLGDLQFGGPIELVDQVGSPRAFQLTDVNSDGMLEPIWSTIGGIRWALNLGDGDFGPPIQGPLIYSEWMEFPDLDTDGDPDLVSGSAFFGVFWARNEGGRFGPLQSTPLDDGIVWTGGTGDLDQDGNVDVIAGILDKNRLTWLPGEALSIVGQGYCGPAVDNATGVPGLAFASGSTVSSLGEFTLHARQLLPGTATMWLLSPNQGFVPQVPGSVGTLCLGASIGRFNQASQVLVSSTAGTTALVVDLDVVPSAGGPVAVQPGETWNFQLWYRDLDPAPTSNFTQGVSVQFQ